MRKEQAIVDLVINGRSAETSIKGIQKAVFETEKLLRNMSKAADPVAYEKLRAELIQLKTAQSQLNAELRVSDSGWGKFKTNITQIGLGTVGGNIFTAMGAWVAGVLPQAITKTAELADEFSDIQKNTGLANDEIEDLQDNLSKINTRTTRKELADLAIEAGKAGKESQEAIESFVRGADVINVSLKEDLGGNAREAIKEVSKIIDIFDIEKDFGIEKSFVKVGSVINELGANSTASEQYIVEYTKRVAGIAPAAKLSIPQVAALAAVMDEQGQSTELAATNTAKMLLSLGKDIPYFAKVAGMSIKDFTSLLNTDANEALLRVVERAKQSQGGLGNLATTFKTLGIEGSEGAAVIGVLANNVARIREMQALANREFESGTSILNEYNLKNNNSAAILEKVERKISGIWHASTAVAEPLIRFFGDLFGVIDRNAEVTSELAGEYDKLSRKESAMKPLIERYNELVLQAAQGRDVNQELSQVIANIAKTMPEAVMQVDRYGNAVEISAQKVQEVLKIEKELFKLRQKQSLPLLQQQQQALQKNIDETREMFNKGVVVDDSFFALLTRKGNKLPTKEMSNDERAKQQQRLLEMQKRNAILQGQIEAISSLDSGRNTSTPTTKPTPTGPTGFIGSGGSDKTPKAKKEVDEYKQLKVEIDKLRQEDLVAQTDQSQRELLIIKFKYDKLREMAKGNKDFINQLNELEAAETQRYNEEQLVKANEAYAKQQAEAQRRADELATRQREAREAIDAFAQNEEESQFAALDNRFQRLLAQAEEAQLTIDQTLPLWEAYWAARSALEEQHYLKSQEKASKARMEELRQVQQLSSNVGDIFASLFEVASTNEVKFAEFRKIATLVKITTDTAAAISSAVATASATGATVIEKAIAITSSIAVVMANIAKAKQALKQADKLKQPTFDRLPGRETGGYTDLASLYVERRAPAGWVSRPTLMAQGARSYIAGEGYMQEYVISNAMLQNPVIANFASMMEAMRVGNMSIGQSTGSGTSLEALEAKFDALLAATYANTAAVQEASQRPIDINYRKIEKIQELIDLSRYDASA